MKTHATVVAVSDVSEHLERLRRLAIPHVYSPASDFMPFDRLWVGQTAEGDSVSYDPQHDAGLWLELLPTSALHVLPHMEIPTLDAAARMSNEGLGVGARIAARSFLVADVDWRSGRLSMRRAGFRSGTRSRRRSARSPAIAGP